MVIPRFKKKLVALHFHKRNVLGIPSVYKYGSTQGKSNHVLPRPIGKVELLPLEIKRKPFQVCPGSEVVRICIHNRKGRIDIDIRLANRVRVFVILLVGGTATATAREMFVHLVSRFDEGELARFW